MFASVSTPCASVLTHIFTPASAARRAFDSERSRRFGLPLISMNVRCSAAAAAIASTSTSYGSRRPIRRPVRCPMQSTCGFSIAAMNRSVIFAFEVRKAVWTLAITQSSRSRTAGS